MAHSSDFFVQMQEEVSRKSSQAACSCCHCQKQSKLLGLHSRSRRNGGTGKYSGQFSACWIKCLINMHWLVQQLFVRRDIVYVPTFWQRYLIKNVENAQNYTQTHIGTYTVIYVHNESVREYVWDYFQIKSVTWQTYDRMENMVNVSCLKRRKQIGEGIGGGGERAEGLSSPTSQMFDICIAMSQFKKPQLPNPIYSSKSKCGLTRWAVRAPPAGEGTREEICCK